MEKDSKGRPLFSVVRVLEYHGTAEWIEATFSASRVPTQGIHRDKLPEGCSIKSGLVNWDIVPPEANLRGEDEQTIIPVPPGPGRGPGRAN